MPTYTVQDTQSNKTIKFEWNDKSPPTDADIEEIFSSAKDFASTEPEQQQEVQQPKLGALKQDPQFSDEPDYSGLPVGVPRQGAGILGKIGSAAVYPMTKVLESNEVFTGEDPFSFGEEQASILDISGHAFRGMLRQGGTSEALIDDITKKEDFGDTAEEFGRFAVQFAGETAFLTGAAKLLSGIGSVKPFIKSFDNIKKDISVDVRKTMEKVIRPRGRKTLKQKEMYYEKATDANIDYIRNKDNIVLNKDGVDVKGELIETAGQWEAANYQQRTSLFEKYHKISTEAELARYQGNPDELIANLQKFVEDPVVINAKPDMARYALEELNKLKMMKARGELTPLNMERLIQAKNENLRLRKLSPDAPTYHKASIDEVYAKYMNDSLDETVRRLPSGDGSKYRETRRLWGAHKQIAQDISDASTRIAHQQPNMFKKGMETFTGYHFLRGAISRNPATFGAAAISKATNAMEVFLGKPNRQIKKMFQRLDKAVSRMDAMAPIIQKVKPKSNKQIGWDGTWTREGSGETIYMGPEEYVPPGLQRAKVGGARSGTRTNVPSIIHPSEAAYPTKKQGLMPSQTSRGTITEEQFRNELITDEMKASLNKQRKPVKQEVKTTLHKAEQAYKPKEVSLRPDQISTLKRRFFPESKKGSPLIMPATTFAKSELPLKLQVKILEIQKTIPLKEIEVVLRPDQRNVLFRRKMKPKSKKGFPLMKPNNINAGSFK